MPQFTFACSSFPNNGYVTCLQVLQQLRSVPETVVERKLAYVDSVRSRFSFATAFTHPPNAVNTMLSEACSLHAGEQQSPAII